MAGSEGQSRLRIVELGSHGHDAAAVAEAASDLERLPGVGAVVVLGPSGEPTAVVTYEHLAHRVNGDRWLASLCTFLASKSYAVLDHDLRPWATPAAARRRLPWLRALARIILNLRRRSLRQRISNGRRRWRRRRFLARLRWEAWLAGTALEVDVAKDLFVEPGIRFQLGAGKALLRIGPRCRLLDGTLLRLRGELVIGPGCEIRQDVSINVKGRIELQGRTVLGKGAMLHADSTMLFEWGASIAEYVTVLDSHHEIDGSLVMMLDQGVRAVPITLGAASFVGAKASVMPGVTIGRSAVVGAGSVVTRDVPAGAVVVGIPARARTS